MTFRMVHRTISARMMPRLQCRTVLASRGFTLGMEKKCLTSRELLIASRTDRGTHRITGITVPCSMRPNTTLWESRFPICVSPTQLWASLLITQWWAYRVQFVTEVSDR